MNLFLFFFQPKDLKSFKIDLESWEDMLRENAECHPNQHVVKMPLEAVQLLYAALAHYYGADLDSKSWRMLAPFNKEKTFRGYKPTHKNHPTAKWVRESEHNYVLCLMYAHSLCEEYTYRYGKKHACEGHLAFLEKMNPWKCPTPQAEEEGVALAEPKVCLVEPLQSKNSFLPLAMPDDCKPDGGKTSAEDWSQVTKAYRKYYLMHKQHLIAYKKRKAPEWLTPAPVSSEDSSVSSI